MSRDIKAGGAYVELLLKSQSFVAGLRSASTRLKAFGDSARKIGSLGMLGGSGGIGRLFAGAGAAAALAWPIKLAANLEVAKAEFEALIGDVGKANTLFAQLQKFALVSPLGMEDLAAAGRKLLVAGVGVDDIVPKLKQLGEIAGGNGEKLNLLALAFAQVTAKGRLMGQEANQLAEAGFSPLAEIARTTGVSVGELMKKMEAGEISVAMVAKALETATSAGGRFHGLLAKIAGTAKGQWDQVREGIAAAVVPLGDALLPGIKDLLKIVNSGMPTISKILKENAEAFATFGKVAAGVAVIGGSLIGFGLIVTGLGMGLGGLAAAFGLLINPITITTGFVAGLGYAFVNCTKMGRTMAASLAGWFGQLQKIASEAFGGIADALAAGELELAGKVAWAGLKAVWYQGINDIRHKWAEFKDSFVRTAINMTHDALQAFTKFAYSLDAIFASVKGSAKNTFIDAVNWLMKIGKTDGEKKAFDILAGAAKRGNAQDTANDIAGIMKERDASLGLLDMGRDSDNKILDDKFAAEQKRIDADLAAARADLARTKEEARIAKEGGFNPQLGGAAPKFDPAMMMSPAALKNEIFGSFNAAALQSQGGGSSVQDKMFDQMRKADNDRRKEAAKLLAAVKDGGVIGP